MNHEEGVKVRVGDGPLGGNLWVAVTSHLPLAWPRPRAGSALSGPMRQRRRAPRKNQIDTTRRGGFRCSSLLLRWGRALALRHSTLWRGQSVQVIAGARCGQTTPVNRSFLNASEISKLRCNDFLELDGREVRGRSRNDFADVHCWMPLFPLASFW
jgi:hypothetical protein